MTPQEINLAIAKLVYPDEKEPLYDWCDMRKRNYCSDWNDLMPLVVEHFLKHQTFDRNKYFLVRAVSKDNEFSTTEKGKTLQLALAKCLLKVLQEKE